MSCSICHEEEEAKAEVTTPCGHVFHRDCIKAVVRPTCPLCKGGLKRFLREQCGVTRGEIRRRVEEDERRILAETLQEGCVGALSEDEVVFLVTHQFRTSTEFPVVVRDVLLDRIFDARHSFLQLSLLWGNRGVFFYYVGVEETVGMALDPSRPSEASWLDTYTGIEPVDGAVADLVRRVQKNPSKTFGVLIWFQNPWKDAQLMARLVDEDPQAHVAASVGGGYVSASTPTLRVSHRDVVCSLTKGASCRCSAHTPTDPNPEEDWAREVLRKESWVRLGRRQS